jgi:V8-like Glu-specific endopeptidase
MTLGSVLNLILLCCVAMSQSSVIPSNAKIIGGIEVGSITQFPYQALIFARYGSGSMISSGAIISPKFVLTCAHCISGSTSASVFYGSEQISNLDFSKNQIVSSENYRIHPKYSTYLNDIALIKMEFSIRFSGKFLQFFNTNRNSNNVHHQIL